MKARCAPFSVRSTPDRSETGGVLSASISSSRALVALPALADAAIDDLLQVIAAGEVADVAGADPRLRAVP